jgi:hypothetical protein
VQPLRRQGREAVLEVEAHLVTEDAAGAGPGPVGLLHAMGEDVVEQVEVLAHGFTLLTTRIPLAP